jgi:hypothetical protein
MENEHKISFPDGGLVASDPGVSHRSCNKPDYHFRIKQLEAKLSEAAEREEMLKEALIKNMQERSETNN